MSKPTSVPSWHLETVVRLADDALILGQRVAQWCGHGPALEEDLAMANIGLDLIGQARMLYTHAGILEGAGRDEDHFAYFRTSSEFRNHSLTELPNGNGPHDDYATTITKNWLHSARMVPVWQHLAESSDQQLAAIAMKAVKEATGHLRHARDWVVRFGDGTEESHQRMQTALNKLWPYTNELFADDAIDQEAASNQIAPLPSSVKPEFDKEVAIILAEATLSQPAPTQFLSTGKQGQHTEHLDLILAEMQSLARAHPGATW
ncbi:MAG: 1,2-phenylacetyl-CoA epoxidase subunit PaaC [Burkholderiaceae bacterium]